MDLKTAVRVFTAAYAQTHVTFLTFKLISKEKYFSWQDNKVVLVWWSLIEGM